MTEDKALAPLIPPVGEEIARCSGCGLRWTTPEGFIYAGVVHLCGDCWRKVQGALHGPPVGEDDPFKRLVVVDRLGAPMHYKSDVDAALTLARQQHAEQTRAEVEKACAGERAEIAHDIAENPNSTWTQDLRTQHAEWLKRSVAVAERLEDKLFAADARAEALAEQIAEKDRKIDSLQARAVVAEQHKVLDRLGRTSYQEVVEDQIRTQLAEAQVALEAAESREAALRATLEEAHAVCICGCPISEHESYGEDGESCEHPEHDCFRTSKAAFAVVAALRAEMARVDKERNEWRHASNIQQQRNSELDDAHKRVKADLKVARHEIETLKQEQAWRPIETCPDDGTWFLGYLDGECSVVRTWKGWAPDDWTPTHWKSLPPPPVDQEKGTTTP